jgi:hypothetical protein
LQVSEKLAREGTPLLNYKLKERIMNGEYTDTWQKTVQRFPMGSPSYREAMNTIQADQLEALNCANQLNYVGARRAEAHRNQAEKSLNMRHGLLG